MLNKHDLEDMSVYNQPLPKDPKERKALPIVTGVLDYFPQALAEVARCSKVGNDQHNPGQPLHWAKGKSTDHADCLIRHLMERGTIDSDGVMHSAKVAWRALAMLQTELENPATYDNGKGPWEQIVKQMELFHENLQSTNT